jgi:hypothetical protein
VPLFACHLANSSSSTSLIRRWCETGALAAENVIAVLHLDLIAQLQVLPEVIVSHHIACPAQASSTRMTGRPQRAQAGLAAGVRGLYKRYGLRGEYLQTIVKYTSHCGHLGGEWERNQVACPYRLRRGWRLPFPSGLGYLRRCSTRRASLSWLDPDAG